VTLEEYESLPREVRAEPFDALVGGTHVHRRLSTDSPHVLRPGGWLVVEMGVLQAEEVRRLMSRSFEDVEVLPDLAGRDRVARGRLPEASG
jgi:release factor glutamine methyltransferase